MNYRSKFKQGKEYFVLDAESALLLQNGEDFQPKLQKVVFEEFSSMVLWKMPMNRGMIWK